MYNIAIVQNETILKLEHVDVFNTTVANLRVSSVAVSAAVDRALLKVLFTWSSPNKSEPTKKLKVAQVSRSKGPSGITVNGKILYIHFYFTF